MFCNAPHPDTPPIDADGLDDCQALAAERAAYGPAGVLRCRRLAGHSGDHAAYGFSVSTPIAWPAADESVA